MALRISKSSKWTWALGLGGLVGLFDCRPPIQKQDAQGQEREISNIDNWPEMRVEMGKPSTILWKEECASCTISLSLESRGSVDHFFAFTSTFMSVGNLITFILRLCICFLVTSFRTSMQKKPYKQNLHNSTLGIKCFFGWNLNYCFWMNWIKINYLYLSLLTLLGFLNATLLFKLSWEIHSI